MPRLPAEVPICLDTRMLVDGGTGVAGYAHALAAAQQRVGGRAMALVDDADAIAAGRLRAAIAPIARRVALRRAGDREQLAGTHLFRAAQVRFTLLRRVLTVKPDLARGVMHWTYPVPMRMAGWINIYTIHDVIPLLQSELSPIDPRRLRGILRRILVGADRIVTVSEAARADIIGQLGCDPRRVVNIGQPVATGVAAAALPDGLRPGGYFLYCGSIEPRKNIAALIRAHAASGTDRPLVLAGPDGWQADAALAGAGGGRVIRYRYLPQPDLVALQAQARALLFPSLAEGFGRPVIEAMALGTPVLTSNRGALAEVAGGAALLVDPDAIAAIAAGIARLAVDDALCATLAERGRQRAERFGAGRFAARLRTVYADAIAERRGFP